MSTAPRERLTETQYLARERAAEEKHEYVNGEMVAMAGAKPRHNLLATNLTVCLGSRLRGGPCLTLNSDQRVHVSATGLYAYPDITVVCGHPEFRSDEPMVLLNPTLVVEVASQSTGDYDRGAKFAHYRRLPSLGEYVVVSTVERRVEHFRRLETGQWLMTEYTEGAVALPALGIAVPIDEIYADIERLPPEEA